MVFRFLEMRKKWESRKGNLLHFHTKLVKELKLFLRLLMQLVYWHHKKGSLMVQGCLHRLRSLWSRLILWNI